MLYKKKINKDCPCSTDCPDRKVVDGKACRVDCERHAEWMKKHQEECAARRAQKDKADVHTEGSERVKRYFARQDQLKARDRR